VLALPVTKRRVDLLRQRAQTLLAALMAVALALPLGSTLTGCSGNKKRSASGARSDPDVVRYRLPLRENPIDSGEAFRCYGACQPEETPTGYLQCLRQCPGFDTTHGVTCADYEVPPYAACLTARKLRPDEELAPGWVALGTVAGVIIAVSLASLCSSSASCSNWGYTGYPLPARGPGSPQ